MINILQDTINAIDNFDITATVEGLRKQHPNMSEAEIRAIISEKLTYLGSGKRAYYSILLSSLEANEKRKHKYNEQLKKLLMLLIADMFRKAINEPAPKLVDTFNNCWIEHYNKNEGVGYVRR